MPAITLANMELRVQRTIGLAATTASHDEKTLVDAWYNEAVEQFLVKTKIRRQTAYLDMVAGQGDYTFDSNVLAFDDIYVAPVTGTPDIHLVPVDTAELRRMRSSVVLANSPPGFYAYEGQLFMIYPAAVSSSDKLHIVYVARPVAMTSGAETPSTLSLGGIPIEYHPILESYVKWKGAEYSNDGPSQYGASYKEQWQTGLIEAKVTESRKGGVRIGTARVGRKNLGFVRSNGVDYGG